MPLPERLQPAKVNRQKLKQLADMAEEILAQIDNGAKEEDTGLKMLINDWNSQVINPYAFSDFRDFSSWTSAKDFTGMAFNQEKYVADLSWDELIQIIQFVRPKVRNLNKATRWDCLRKTLMPIHPTSSTGLMNGFRIKTCFMSI